MNDPRPVPPFRQWLKLTTPMWNWNYRYQTYLFQRLDALTTGKIRRLMVFMPPRHFKSETLTVRYAAWRLENDPALNIIIGSYAQKLANRFSRKVRRLLETRILLSQQRRGAEEWETEAGGGVRAVGVGGGITGFGASLIIIDDPVKNRAQAESEVFRDRTWEWFNDDIYTRLEPAGSIVLIQTRWHDDDLAGRILKAAAADREKWEVVSFAALAEQGFADPLGRSPGKALCPKRFSEKRLNEIRRQLGSYSFAALYQQRPFPLEGGLFKRKWFTRFVEREPDGLRWVRAYDLAVSTETSADHTASFRCAFGSAGELYIAGGMRRRMEYPDQRRYVIERMVEEKNTAHVIENALHGKAFVQDLRREARVAGVPLRSANVDGDKFTRSLSWANLAESGKIVIVRGPWNDDLLDEVCRFTGKGDKHDDQVDAISLAVSSLRQKGTVKFIS